ncbi:fasciclin-like arabinogalactan protein 11 [Wolffia australiana]
MASHRVFALLALLLVLQAPASDAQHTKEVIVILNHANQFRMLIKLLQDTGILNLIQNAIDNPNPNFQGITVFAFNDVAFRKLPPGFIENRTLAQKRRLLQYQVLVGFFTFNGLSTLNGPVNTLAGVPLTIVQALPSRPFVSSGSVITAVKNPLTEDFSASVFLVFDVLIPPGL